MPTRCDNTTPHGPHTSYSAGWGLLDRPGLPDTTPADPGDTPGTPTGIDLTAAYDDACQRVSEMNGWDYDDQARAAVDAALPHITGPLAAELERTRADRDEARAFAEQHYAHRRHAETVVDVARVWRHGDGEPGYDAAAALTAAVDAYDALGAAGRLTAPTTPDDPAGSRVAASSPQPGSNGGAPTTPAAAEPAGEEQQP